MLLSRLRNLPPRRADALLASAIFLAALGLRLVGIGWGLPDALHNQSFHPDELDNYIASQQIQPAKLDFAPGFYNYGTLYLTVLRISSDVAKVYSGAGEDIWKQAAVSHLAGRLVNAFAGAGTAVLIYFILRRFTSRLAAVMGALLLAFAPGHVVHSRFQTVDVFQAFMLAASLYFALKLIPTTDEAPDLQERWDFRPAIWSGAFAGLSASTKYTGGVAVFAVLAALALSKRPGWWKPALAAIGAMVAAFLVTTPGAVTDTSKFVSDVIYEFRHTSTGHGLVFVGYPSGFLFQAGNLVVGVGLLLTLMGTFGLAAAGIKRTPWMLAILASAIPYYILIGRAEVMFLRYTFPLVVALALGFGWLMDRAHRAKGPMLLVVVLGMLGLGGLEGGLRGSIAMTALMTAEDSRDAAARYLKEAASTGTVGLVSDPWFYTPPLYPNTGLPRRAFDARARDREMMSATSPRVVYVRPTTPTEPEAWNTRLLSEVKPDYIVYSSFESYDPARLQGRKDIPSDAQIVSRQAAEFIELMRKDYVPDRLFGKGAVFVHDLEYIYPEIVVWKRKPGPLKTQSSGS